MCEPGCARLTGPGRSRVIRRTRVATVSTATTRAVRHCAWLSVLIAGSPDDGLGGPVLGVGQRGGGALGLEHPVEDPAYPHAARVDVEAVELVVGVGLDGLLLGAEHR